MPDRYTFHDHDTRGVVVNTQTGEATRYDLVRDAEAAARRLNASEPKRAKDAMRWALVNPSGRFVVGSLNESLPVITTRDIKIGWRIARVRITEIEQEASDGE